MTILGYVTWGFSSIVPVYNLEETSGSMVSANTPKGPKLIDPEDLKPTPDEAVAFSIKELENLSLIYTKEKNFNQAEECLRHARTLLSAELS